MPVAKHGNRALSSKSGAADVLTALGVKIDLAPETVARCIREAGIGFMFAPAHHAAMKHVGPTRAELGTRTIFNLLGPLANPAGRQALLLGVFAPEWVEPIAEALRDLGTERAWVVHGAGGLDEISSAGADQGRGARRTARSRPSTITPERRGHGVRAGRRDQGRRRQAQRRGARGVLGGASGAYRDTVLLNAARRAGRRRHAPTDLAEGAPPRRARRSTNGQAPPTRARSGWSRSRNG